MYWCNPKNIACPFANYNGYCSVTACTRQFPDTERTKENIIKEIYLKLSDINNLLKELEQVQ